jgi:hypothetical protein
VGLCGVLCGALVSHKRCGAHACMHACTNTSGTGGTRVKLVGLEQGSMSVWKRIRREMVKDVFCNTAVCVLSCVQAWGQLT